MMQIVHTMQGNLLRAQGREIVRSNGDGTTGDYLYADTFIETVDSEPYNINIAIASQDGVLPSPTDFDDYTVTVTIDITPNA